MPQMRPSLSRWRGGPLVNRVVLLVALILGVMALAPTAQQFVQQRQQISDIRNDIAVQQQHAEQRRSELSRWSDPAYVEAQSRSRLFYAKPGDTVYFVSGGVHADTSRPVQQVSPQQHPTKHDWVDLAVTSIVEVGTRGEDK